MKILVLCSQAKDTGAHFRAEYIYKYLKKAGAEAEYIYPPYKSMPFMLDFIFSMVYYFFAVMNRKPDYVIILKPYPNTVLPALILKAGGARIIIDIDDLDYGYRTGPLSDFIKWLQHYLTKPAALITSHNTALIKQISKEHPELKNRIYRLNQCVDLDIFSPGKAGIREINAIRNSYKGKKLLFYMANLNIASCLESVLDALAHIKDDNVLLLVAGGGPLLQRYRKAAAKRGLMTRAVFLGPVERSRAAEYIMAADLCLVYYNEEPVNRYRASMKLREYLAMSRPVVATGVGEIKDFKKILYLCRPTPKAFAAEIIKHLKNLDKREKKGYKVIRKNYEWGKETRKFLKFLQKDGSNNNG
jgi:glycosyltransferase involved in cell wall biosynthesis